MKRIQVSAITTLCVAVFFMWQCSPTSTGHSGNSSQTGNGVIAGTLYLPDSTRAVGVRVVIRPRTTLADTSLLGLSKRMADTASAVTDASGRFVIDSIDTGTYVIEAASGNNAVFIDSVVVKRTDSTLNLPPDTLKPAGAIKGVIRLSEGGDLRKVFVLAFGVDRFAGVEADGRFRFQGLAEASYRLRIISTLDDYGVVDTVTTVRSADTTDLGVIELPFTGIPTPKNVMISYDTLKQVVTLSWDRADTGLVKSYNVYRRNVDSNTVLSQINTSPITDTFYRDSTGVQDQTYEYKVASVSKQDMEGTRSEALTAEIIGAFRLISSFGGSGSTAGLFNNPTGLAFSKDSSVLVADVQNHRIQKFDMEGNFISSYGVNGSDSGEFNFPVDISVDGQGNIFVADQENNRVQKFNSDFVLVGIYDSGLTRPQTVAVDSKGNLYVNEISTPKIKKFDANLRFIQEWGRGGSNDIDAIGSPQSVAIDSMDRIYVVENSLGKVVIFDTLGNFIKAINADPSGGAFFTNPIDISIIGGNIYISDIGVRNIALFDLEGNLLAKWGNNKFYSILALPTGQIWASVLAEQKIYRFQK